MDTIAKFDVGGVNVVNSVITESAGKIGIGAATPAGPLDVGGWTGLPGNIVGVSANLSGDAFMGNTGVNVGRFRMAATSRCPRRSPGGRVA